MCALYLVGQINVQPVPPYLSKMVKIPLLFYNSFLTIIRLYWWTEFRKSSARF
jgi:hypothetical protein